MAIIKLRISDETLRDGEQQVGLCFQQDVKRNLAHLINTTGVTQIAVMPAIHPTEEQFVMQLMSEGMGERLAASTMMTTAAIDQSVACDVQQIILFHAVSDRLLFLRDLDINNHPAYAGKTIDAGIPADVVQRIRQNMISKVLNHLRYAASKGLTITFAAEDASRADFTFLCDCISLFAPYIDHFLLCDTVGILTPEKSYVWIHDLLQETNYASLSVHFHNDMGVALENTIQAVLAGASGISGTFGGLGERAGNVALEQALHGLRLRFGWEVEHIDYDAIARVTAFLERVNARPHAPYSQATQRHESGIHVHSLLRDRQSYVSLPHNELEIWFGKYSGASNFRYLFEHYLQTPLPREQYKQLSADMKAIAIEQNRSFSVEDVLRLFDQGILRVRS